MLYETQFPIRSFDFFSLVNLPEQISAVSQSVNQSVSQSINQSVSQSVSQSLSRLSVCQSVSRSASFCQSVNQSVNQEVYRSIYASVCLQHLANLSRVTTGLYSVSPDMVWDFTPNKPLITSN